MARFMHELEDHVASRGPFLHRKDDLTVESVGKMRAFSDGDFWYDSSVSFKRHLSPLSDVETASECDSCDLSSDSSDLSTDDEPWREPLAATSSPVRTLVAPPGVFSQPPRTVAVPVQVTAFVVEHKPRESDVPEELRGKHLTTVMLRNLPNNLNRCGLLDLLDNHGFAARYNFMYLPIDFARQANLGYAFVNLVDEQAAEEFKVCFQGFSEWNGPSKKVCEVLWSTPCQGLDDHILRYRNSPVMHPAVPDECKPALFQFGERVPFPEPTKAIQRPRFRMPPAKTTFWQKNAKKFD